MLSLQHRMVANVSRDVYRRGGTLRKRKETAPHKLSQAFQQTQSSFGFCTEDDLARSFCFFRARAGSSSCYLWSVGALRWFSANTHHVPRLSHSVRRAANGMGVEKNCYSVIEAVTPTSLSLPPRSVAKERRGSSYSPTAVSQPLLSSALLAEMEPDLAQHLSSIAADKRRLVDFLEALASSSHGTKRCGDRSGGKLRIMQWLKLVILQNCNYQLSASSDSGTNLTNASLSLLPSTDLSGNSSSTRRSLFPPPLMLLELQESESLVVTHRRQLPYRSSFTVLELSSVCTSFARLGYLHEDFLLAVGPRILDTLHLLCPLVADVAIPSVDSTSLPLSAQGAVDHLVQLLRAFQTLRFIPAALVCPLLQAADRLVSASNQVRNDALSTGSLTEILSCLACLNLPSSHSWSPVTIWCSVIPPQCCQSTSAFQESAEVNAETLHVSLQQTSTDLVRSLLTAILAQTTESSFDPSARELVKLMHACTKLLPDKLCFATSPTDHASSTVCGSFGLTDMSDSVVALPSAAAASSSDSFSHLLMQTLWNLQKPLSRLSSKLRPWEVEVACVALHCSSKALRSFYRHLEKIAETPRFAVTLPDSLAPYRDEGGRGGGVVEEISDVGAGDLTTQLGHALESRAADCIPQFSSKTFCTVLAALVAEGFVTDRLWNGFIVQLPRVSEGFQPNDIALLFSTFRRWLVGLKPEASRGNIQRDNACRSPSASLSPPLWAEALIPLLIEKIRLFDKALLKRTLEDIKDLQWRLGKTNFDASDTEPASNFDNCQLALQRQRDTNPRLECPFAHLRDVLRTHLPHIERNHFGTLSHSLSTEEVQEAVFNKVDYPRTGQEAEAETRATPLNTFFPSDFQTAGKKKVKRKIKKRGTKKASDCQFLHPTSDFTNPRPHYQPLTA